MPLDQNIYNQAGRVNLGSGLSDIVNQQRQRDLVNEQRQNTLASLAMQQQASQQKQTQQRGQDLNMWLSSAVQSGRPQEEVMQEAIAKGAEIGVAPEVTQRHVQSVFASSQAPQARSDYAFTQAYPELVAKQRAESMFARPASQAAPSNIGKMIQEREAIPAGDPRRKMYDAAISKATEITQKTGIGQPEWKYDPGSDEWVAAPTVEAPQGQRTGSISKLNAVTAAKDLISEFKGTKDKPGLIYTAPTGGVMGLTGQLAKVSDSQKIREFDNIRESISTQLRTVFRIPGEGALSDKEQAQYGLQLPDVRNDPDVNERILTRIEKSLETRVSPTVVETKKPQQPNQQDAEAVAWARANPNDPRSARILSLQGK